MEVRLVLLGSGSFSRSTAATNHSALPTKNTKEGGERGVGRKQKGHFLTNIHFRTPALNASSKSSLLPGVGGRIL